MASFADFVDFTVRLAIPATLTAKSLHCTAFGGTRK
jgi:hypothetical protein